MKTNFKRFMGMAISAAMLIQPAAIFAENGETEHKNEINYALYDEFEKGADGQYATCGWTVGSSLEGYAATLGTHWSKEMPMVQIPTGGSAEPGKTAVFRKDLESPIDLTKNKVVIETVVSADTTYGINVDFGYNRPSDYTTMSSTVYSGNENTLFRITGAGGQITDGNGNAKGYSELSMLKPSHGLTQATVNGKPQLFYGDDVKIKMVLDYTKNLVNYYITTPDGKTYTRDGWGDDGNMKVNGASPTTLESIDFSAWCEKGSKYWIDYVKVYKIAETEATVKTDGRCDTPIKVNFTNADDIAADLSDFVTLQTKNGTEVPARLTYADGTVTITPESTLADETEYSVLIDTAALSELAIDCKTESLSFKTLGEGVYVDDILTTSSVGDWEKSDGITFPGNHWAGGNAAMWSGSGAGSVTKTLANPVDLTSGKIMLDVSIMTDTGANVDFCVNGNNIFGVGYDGGSGKEIVQVKTQNGTSSSYNPAMTINSNKDKNEIANGKPYAAFAEKINVKAILDYSTKTISYYVAFSDNPNTTNIIEDEYVRIYTRDGWGDKNNMPNISEITNLSFTTSDVSKKFWIESVKVADVKTCEAEIFACTTAGVDVKFTGAEGDFGEYIDLYTPNGEKIETEKTYAADTNTVRLGAELEAGEPYMVKVQSVKMISRTGVSYGGNLELGFIPTVHDILLTRLDTNRGVGGYFRASLKNTGTEEKTVMIVIAEKNSDGELIQADIDQQTIAAGEGQSFEANFTSVNSENTLEAYVWDAKSNAPIIKEYTVLKK